MSKEPSDKMRETNVKFYDIINSEDWDTQFNNIDERQDSILQLLENLNLKNKYVVDKIG